MESEKKLPVNQDHTEGNPTPRNTEAFSPPGAVRLFTGLFGGWIGIIIVIKIVSMVIIAFSNK